MNCLPGIKAAVEFALRMNRETGVRYLVKTECRPAGQPEDDPAAFAGAVPCFSKLSASLEDAAEHPNFMWRHWQLPTANHRRSSYSFSARRNASMPATRTKKRKPTREELNPGECLCEFCTGVCCRYFSLPIDNPTTWDEFDTIRWYLAHGQTIIYVEKGQWYILVTTALPVPEGR